GLEAVPDLDSVVLADVVLSVAPPDQAEAIARDVDAAAKRVGMRPLFADLNATSTSWTAPSPARPRSEPGRRASTCRAGGRARSRRFRSRASRWSWSATRLA